MNITLVSEQKPNEQEINFLITYVVLIKTYITVLIILIILIGKQQKFSEQNVLEKAELDLPTMPFKSKKTGDRNFLRN